MVVLAGGMFVGFKKPFRIWKAVAAGVAVVVWLISGILGEGIGV